MAGDLPFVFPRASVQGSPSQKIKQSVCVSLSLSLSLCHNWRHCAAFCFGHCCCCCWFFFLRALLISLPALPAFSPAPSPASVPFGAIVLVKLTICIQLRYALCPAADEARLSSQKYAQDAHSDSSPSLSFSLSCPLSRRLCICGLIYFHLLCHNNLYSLFSFGLRQTHSQYLCRYIRICCCSCWLLNAIAATNLIWP